MLSFSLSSRRSQSCFPRPVASPSLLLTTLLLALGGAGCGGEPAADTSRGVEPANDEGQADEKDAGVRNGGKRDATSDSPKKDAGGPPPVVPDDGTNKCSGIRNDAPGASGGVDVIFLIDTSGSMLHAATQVQANISQFVQDFEATNADTRVVMITGIDPAAGTPVGSADNYRFIPSSVDSKALFSVALLAFPQYEDFLRPTASVQFVMITDDNDALPPPAFREQMKSLLGGRDFIQHAIASENVNGLPCTSEAAMANPLCIAPIPAICAAASVGDAYYTLAEQTGGATMSICKADWSTVFSELRSAVIAAVPLPCSYALSEASNEDFDSELVQVLYTPPEGGDDSDFPRATSFDVCGDKFGWYYDDPAKPSSINLCPKACETVAAGGSLDIAFGCKPPLFL
jgi:hypothetical protein